MSSHSTTNPNTSDLTLTHSYEISLYKKKFLDAHDMTIDIRPYKFEIKLGETSKVCLLAGKTRQLPLASNATLPYIG